MKELAEKEKAQRYDEAIEKGKQIQNTPYVAHWDIMKEVVEHLLPELKESEDEMVRKWLINLLGEMQYHHCDDEREMGNKALAWLEKQGDHAKFRNVIQIGDKVTRNEFGVLVNLSQLKRVAKPADKVGPKFKVGDWVVYTGYLLKDSGKESYVMQVASVEDDRYNFTDTSTLCFDSEKDMRSWTIQDAKDGDVLVASDDSIFIFAGVVDCACKYYVALTADNCIKINKEVMGGYWETSRAVYPATKEQRDTLMKAIAGAGYTFDFENKQLKKIEQKPAWSEEDEKFFKTALWHISYSISNGKSTDIHCDTTDWFKSLKDRVQSKQEWSKEDEKRINHIIAFMSDEERIKDTKRMFPIEEDIRWLKSLRPQNTWKPSENELEVLRLAAEKDGTCLMGLYENLKKLREE